MYGSQTLPPPDVRQAFCISQSTTMGEQSGVHKPLRMHAAVKSDLFFHEGIISVNIRHIAMPSLSHRAPRSL